MNLREMFGLRVPIISVVIGEGGSGGALAIGCANRNLIMENSVYYVASPEACAAILWRSRADAALVRCLRLLWAAWRTGCRGSWLNWRPCGLHSRRPVAEQGPLQSWRASWWLSCALRYNGGSTWQTPGMRPYLGLMQHLLVLGQTVVLSVLHRWQSTTWLPALGQRRLEQCTVEHYWASCLA